MSTKFDAAKKVAGWCSDPQNQAPGTQVLEVPGAQENANRRATGDSAIDWIDHLAKLLPNSGPERSTFVGMQPPSGVSRRCHDGSNWPTTWILSQHVV